MTSNLSYQEKSIWGSLIATSVICGRFIATGERFILGTITLLVLVQIVVQVAILIGTRREPKDERDKLIEAKGFRAGYVLLVIGVIICMNRAGQLTAGALIAALLTAEIGKSIAQLVSYRRGV